MIRLAYALNDEIIDDLKTILGDGFAAIVEEQVKQAKIYLEEITVAIAQNNPDVAMRHAHALKSSCNQIGLSGIATIAKELEFACRADSKVGATSETAREAFRKIGENFHDAVAHLRREIATKKKS